MAYRPARFPGSRRVLAADAVGRYDLRRTMMARLLASNPALSLLLLVGDVEMDELDLDPHAGAEAVSAAFTRPEPDVHGLIIAGNLLVHQAVQHPRSNSGMSLYVLGDLKARNVAISGLELVVHGELRVSEVFAGAGPSGGARLDGDVRAKLLVSEAFPMLVGGGLKAPVLETGRTRIGVVEGQGVREAKGEVPPSLVLTPQVLEPGPEGVELFSWPRFKQAVATNVHTLSPDYLSGRTNLESMRELRRLEHEIEQVLSEGRYARGAELLRKARALGAPRGDTGVQLADAIYRVHHGTGSREALAEALELLDETLGPKPDAAAVMAHPQALLQRAHILLLLKEHDDEAFDQAWRDCSLAAVTMPAQERAGIAGLMGQWLFTRHRYDECVPYLRQALAADPEDGAQHGRLARALWMLDRESEALPHATRSLELNPADNRMWYVRGKCQQVLGDPEDARLDLATYLEMHPDDDLAVEALIIIDLDADNTDQAVESALQFIEHYPDIDGAPARFGRLLHLRERYDLAVPLLRRAMQVHPEDQTIVRDLAVALSQAGTGHDQTGLDTALRRVEIDSEADHIGYLRAEVNLTLDDPSAAEGDLEEYLTRFPEAVRALASLASIRLLQLRPAEAEALIDRARSIAPDDPYVESVADKAGFGPTIDLAAAAAQIAPSEPTQLMRTDRSPREGEQPGVTQYSFRDAGFRRP
ncbi:tetratricopeptide repeat protein [Kineosporia succinea]|uniref:Tetratricopeptide (TPR) repeat protein n=1 Tax=Kineosporia succinea TaxID=84632 RepID=A0ABT9P3U7_9ACTN|nr:tetratricopeptide repeat protein [Kineosporia succinea]MDP9827348.1 tetratricopeptide (TPR) repeat protein [Kineosporia succinea]